MASINGREYQMATTVWTVVAGNSQYELTSVRSFDYKVAAPKEPVRSKKGEQIAYTIKDEDTSGSKVRLLQSEFRDFVSWIATNFPNTGICEVAFDVSVLYGNTPAVYKQDRLDNVMIDELAFSASNDQNALEVEVPLFVLKVHPADGEAVIYT